MSRTEIALPSGTLTLDVEQAQWPLDALCTFAVRANPRRGFLIVSRVLGKHVPVRPSVMRATYEDLAADLTTLDLPPPALFIALAETATGLGQGVFAAMCKLGAWPQVSMFVHTTRAVVPGAEVAFRFEEPHSHAPAHVVYRPTDSAVVEVVERARSLVLVDDEISTGATLKNLACAYARTNPLLERVVLVSLTDWLAEPETLAARMPAPVERVSLLRGRFGFRPEPSYRAPPPSPPPGCELPSRVSRSFGRFGLHAPCDADPAALDALLARPATDRLLVLGTGEHLYAPYRLALALEERGRDVMFQSTTRSPILPGPAITQTLSFPDPTDGVTPSFVYNVDPARYDHVVVCDEVEGILSEPPWLS
jgi:hypothetical protein